MKVYELIDKLMKAPAGSEVVVGMHSTLNTSVERVTNNTHGSVLVITGGDAQLIDTDDDECGLLSWHADRTEEDEADGES